MRPDTPFNRAARWLILTAAVGVILILGFAAIRLGSQEDIGQTIAISPFPTISTLDWTPIAPFAQVDPSIMAYLQYSEPMPLQILGDGIPPIGAYLPKSGNTQFVVITSTPTPTVTFTPTPTITPVEVFQSTQTPFPTSTITPVEVIPPTALPTVTATIIVPTSTPVQTVAPGTECAPSGLPVAGLLTQRFYIGHIGIDLAVPPGTPVVATHSGYVDWAAWNIYGYGNLVIIHSDHFITYYGHNSAVNVKKGDFVNKGSVIAFSGNTGHSSGPHVHYETRINDVTVDPLTFESRGYRSC